MDMKLLILIFSGYLLGSIPFSYLVSRYMGKVDIRDHGSGNVGATNVVRTLGKKAGLIAFGGDFLKGLAAALIGHFLSGQDGAIVCGTAAVFGHCYPFTLGFKGGKGVSTTTGAIIGSSPLITLILAFVQLGTLALSKYMSLASILSAASFPIISLFLGMSTQFTTCSFILGIFIIYRHKANLKRLLSGKEQRFSWNRKM